MGHDPTSEITTMSYNDLAGIRVMVIDDQSAMRRIWLAMPNSRTLPEDHAVLWGDTRAGARRGGIGNG